MDKLLQKIGKKFSTKFEPLTVDDHTFEILAVENMPAYLDRLIAGGSIRNPLRDLPLWAKVWPASFILGRHLRKFPAQGKTLLELGAGMGVCSLIASRYNFASICATDINEDALDFARANILKNGLADIVSARSLDIARGGADPRFEKGVDFIIGSEILYLDDLHRPLINFLQRHLARDGVALFCSDMARAKPRFQKLAEKAFKTTETRVGVKAADAEGKEERRLYTILTLERK